MRPTKWICSFLTLALLLQPLACSKRVCPKMAGETCASSEDEILYVTLSNGNQFELVHWEIGPEWVTGQRELVNVTIEDDGTVTEEEYLEPMKLDLSEVKNLSVERVDRRSLWIVGAIAGGVVAGFFAMANVSAGGDDEAGASGPDAIGQK